MGPLNRYSLGLDLGLPNDNLSSFLDRFDPPLLNPDGFPGLNNSSLLYHGFPPDLNLLSGDHVGVSNVDPGFFTPDLPNRVVRDSGVADIGLAEGDLGGCGRGGVDSLGVEQAE